MSTTEVSNTSSTPSMNYTFIGHIVSEVLVIGGLSFYFNKRISNLEQEVLQLRESLKNIGGGDNEELLQFQATTQNHIKNLYSIIQSRENRERENRDSAPILKRPSSLKKEQPKEVSFSLTPNIEEVSSNEDLDKELEDEIEENVDNLESIPPKKKPN